MAYLVDMFLLTGSIANSVGCLANNCNEKSISFFSGHLLSASSHLVLIHVATMLLIFGLRRLSSVLLPLFCDRNSSR